MKNKKLVPYTVILNATKGDPEAIEAILEHYDGFIDHHSKRTLYDEYGNPHTAIDPEIKERIRSEIIDKVINDFDPYCLPEGEHLES